MGTSVNHLCQQLLGKHAQNRHEGKRLRATGMSVDGLSWQSASLACVMPWVPSSVLHKMERAGAHGIPLIRRWTQDDQEFKVSFDCIPSSRNPGLHETQFQNNERKKRKKGGRTG